MPSSRFPADPIADLSSRLVRVRFGRLPWLLIHTSQRHRPPPLGPCR